MELFLFIQVIPSLRTPKFVIPTKEESHQLTRQRFLSCGHGKNFLAIWLCFSMRAQA